MPDFLEGKTNLAEFVNSMIPIVNIITDEALV